MRTAINDDLSSANAHLFFPRIRPSDIWLSVGRVNFMTIYPNIPFGRCTCGVNIFLIASHLIFKFFKRQVRITY